MGRFTATRISGGDISTYNPQTQTGQPSHSLVETAAGDIYFFYSGLGNDPYMAKSTDGGATWTETHFTNDTVSHIAVWYDRWTDGTGDLIHVVWCGVASDDVEYFNIDTSSSDSKSTPVIVFTGASAVGNEGHLSITKSRGGNLYCSFCIDNGAEYGFYRSTDSGASWSSRSDVNEGDSDDTVSLAPGFAADNQDIMAIFWDASASEISRKVYDDSANTWSETSIATTMDNGMASGFSRQQAAPVLPVVCDYSNSQLLFAAWSSIDTTNADLRTWTIDESTITESTTNTVLNSGGGQGGVGMSLDVANDEWYVFYCGDSSGGETYATNSNAYYKVSDDAGVTWSAEKVYAGGDVGVSGVFSIQRWASGFPFAMLHDRTDVFIRSASGFARARLSIGIA